MIIVVLAAFALMAESTPAAQSAPTPAATAVSAPASGAATTPARAADNPMAMVCKSEPVLGSRLPTKRCRTQGDIAQQRLDDRAALERAQIRIDPGH